MGDRIHASITIRGHIATVDAFEELINALLSMDLRSNGGGKGSAALHRAFAHALAQDESPYFDDDEINYGDVSEVSDVCREHGIAYERTYEATGGDEAGSAVWYPGDEKEIYDSAGEIGGWALAELLEQPDPLSALRAKAAELKHAAGADLGQLSISDEVRDHLTVAIGRAAVLAA